MEAIALSGGIFLLNEYLKHRKKLIEENRQDELISSRIKKSCYGIYNRMNSRSPTPQKTHLESFVREKMNDFIPDGIVEDTFNMILDNQIQTFKVKLRDQTPDKKSTLSRIFGKNPLKKSPLTKAIREIKEDDEKVLDISTEQFMQKLLLFIRDEIRYQSENDEKRYQSHKLLTTKLMKSLDLQNRQESEKELKENI